MEQETVTITKSEYDRMEQRLMWLDALDAAGVDNWGGYDEARSIYNEWKDEE